MSERGGGRVDAVDPLVIQAEKILAQRQARLKTIDGDLLGEPGWDIMLRAFIEKGKGSGCRADLLPNEIGASPEVTRRWIAILADRGMVEVEGKLLALTDKAESKMRRMFSAQLKELMHEIAKVAPETRSRS